MPRFTWSESKITKILVVLKESKELYIKAKRRNALGEFYKDIGKHVDTDKENVISLLKNLGKEYREVMYLCKVLSISIYYLCN